MENTKPNENPPGVKEAAELLGSEYNWKPCPFTDGNQCKPDCPLWIEREMLDISGCAYAVQAIYMVKLYESSSNFIHGTLERLQAALIQLVKQKKKWWQFWR